jgi:formate hydrogenlyase subunit 6/NADH:ubiquinone oxidoreductase subunit I
MNGHVWVIRSQMKGQNAMFLIDRNLCSGCGQCVDVCPAGAITMQDAKAVINQSLCKQCGLCVGQCPVQAISENAPTYAAQAKQPKPLPSQRPGILSQVLDMAERLFVKGSIGGGRGQGRRCGGRGRGKNDGGRGRW